MAGATLYLKIAIIVLVLALPLSVAHADGPGPTPTPGNPGGDHTMPLPEIPSIETLKSRYGIPDADDPSSSRITFFWDLDNWIIFAESSRIGVWFVNNRAFGLATVIVILLIVMAIIRSMSESVYGAGVDRWDRMRGRD